MWWLTYPTILLLFHVKICLTRMDCSKSQYEKCTKMADPLVKEAHLVFPDNINDIDQVCTTWNQFVDCLKIYTDECFTAQQRKQFNRAVESPIESVHEMCTQPSFQKEYLLYAPCIKNTIVQNIHCGNQYNLLVDQVDQGDVISKTTLCCSHDRFKQCVQRETRRLCDRGVAEGPANRFAMQIIDKALRFLQDQCLNYIPNSGDCQIHPTDNIPFGDRSDPLTIATVTSDPFSWSTAQQQKTAKELFPSKTATTKLSTALPWSPSPPLREQPTNQLFSTQLLGTRTRPASYGRSSSWGGSSPEVAGNTVQMYSDLPTTSPTRPGWVDWNRERISSTPSGFGSTRNSENAYSTSSSTPAEPSTMWYPAAGNQLDSEVDEPNQLGLKKPRNSATSALQLASSWSVLVLLVSRYV